MTDKPLHHWDEKDDEWVIDRLDTVLNALVPLRSDQEIRDLFEQRLREANESYQDFLSRPEA